MVIRKGIQPKLFHSPSKGLTMCVVMSKSSRDDHTRFLGAAKPSSPYSVVDD